MDVARATRYDPQTIPAPRTLACGIPAILTPQRALERARSTIMWRPYSAARRSRIAAGTLVRPGIISIVDQGFISVGNFASTVIVARALEAPDFGVYVLANVVISLVIAIQHGLLLQPFVINGASLDDQAFRRFLRANVVLQVIFIAAGSLVVAGVALLWEPVHALAFPIMVTAALSQAQEFCRRTLYARAHMRAALINNAVRYDVQALLLAVAAWLVGITVSGALWIVASTSLLAVLLGGWQFQRFATQEGDDPRAAARLNLQIGKWMGATVGIGALVVHGYPMILTQVAGLATTAGYGVVRQLLGPLNLLHIPISNVYLPRAAHALAEEGTIGLSRVLGAATLLVAPLHLVYALTVAMAPEVFLRMLYGERYVHYAPELRLWLLVSSLSIPLTILGLEVDARRLQRYALLAQIWVVPVIFGLGTYLIAQFGLSGAAVTTAVAQGGELIFLALVVLRIRSAMRRSPDSATDN